MAESTLTYTFEDLYTDVADFAGFSRSPDTTDLATAKRRVNEGYRSFLNSHNWNFLKRSAVLTTESAKWFYDLPDDFESLVVPFKFPTDKGWSNPEERDEALILELRTGSGASSGRPYVFALRPKEYAPEEGTRWQVIFHYQPNGVYEMIYTYRLAVNELVNNSDVPIGGPEHASTIRTFCLAEVEAFDEEKPGTWTARMPLAIGNSIKKDNRKSARSLGVPSRAHGFERREQTITYNGVSVD